MLGLKLVKWLISLNLLEDASITEKKIKVMIGQ